MHSQLFSTTGFGSPLERGSDSQQPVEFPLFQDLGDGRPVPKLRREMIDRQSYLISIPDTNPQINADESISDRSDRNVRTETRTHSIS